MENFKLEEVQSIRNEVEEALKAIATKYNSEISVGKIKYGKSVNLQIEFAKFATDATGASFVLTKEAQSFIDYVWKHQIPAEALNVEFVHNNDKIVITGFKTSNSKYPVTYTTNGKSYKCASAHMARMVKTSLPSVGL